MKPARQALLLVTLVAVAARLAAAGCAGEIFDCRAQQKQLCDAAACAAGLVCRVDNCKGCTAKCERPGTVHIMSLPSAGTAPSSGGSGGSGSTITQEAGCKCPKSYMPVCGSNGQRYDNACLAECAKTTVTDKSPDSNGNCPKPAPSGQQQQGQASQQGRPRPQGQFTCRCANAYKPVCGTDGKFYSNECMAICEGVKVSSVTPDLDAKKCDTAAGTASAAAPGGPSCPCPRNFMPVCGSDGKVYNNACLAKCAGATVTEQPPNSCKPVSSSSNKPAVTPPPGSNTGGPACACPAILAPVCGADGKVYDNNCIARCRGVAVTATTPDACKPSASKPAGPPQQGSGGRACACPRILRRVCGTDGKVYDNSCLAKCAGVLVTEDPPESCKPLANKPPSGTNTPGTPGGRVCACPKILRPVCGSNGKVYDNDCLANCAGVSVTDQSPDSCKPAASKPQGPLCACPFILKPVCGSNGKVYDNDCLAKCAGVKVTDLSPDSCKPSKP